MGLFSSPKNYLGVDLGSAAIKIVELGLEKGRPKLVTYGYIEEISDLLRANKTEVKDKIADALKMIIDKSKVTTNKAVAALPSFTVFSSIISIPEMPKKELVEAIKWEAKKFVPMPLEEMILDWKELGELKKGSVIPAPSDPSNSAEKRVITESAKMKKILLTAAPKDLVSKYVEIFRKAGLELVSLETESFAIERALVGNDKAAIMIIDLGAQVTNIAVVLEGVPLINRSIDIGGFSLTKAISTSMNIDIQRAEQFKRDFGITPSGGEAEKMPAKMEIMVNSIINEIKYVINLYHNQSAKTIEKIIFTGGSSLLPNLPEYVGKELGVNTYIGDPWSRVVCPVELTAVLKELGPSFSVAVGLALREIT